MKKKILILGVTGQDGSTLADFLVKKKYHVYGLIRKSSNRNYQNIKNVINKKNFNLVQGDMLDFISIENIIKRLKPDEIYNFADQDHVRWSSQIPFYSFDVTAKSVFNILNLVKIHSPKSKFFQPFSSNMFGNTKKSKLNENESFSPLSVYALSKVSAFYICEYFKKVHNLKIFGAIYFNHESEKRTEEYVSRKIIKNTVRIFLNKQKYLFLGDVNIKIDWGYAKDYVIAAYKMMQLKKPDFFIIGSGKAHSIKYFVKKSFEYLGLDYKKHLRIDKKLIRKVKTKTLIANTKKARKIFKFKPSTSLNKLIKIMIENDLKIETNNKNVC
jgi:GDPmannose 4,6-dehydratase|tara:strand:- start:54 stop:1037 length:984 start_codon:yes stop_codon:yes gene_type:complete